MRFKRSSSGAILVEHDNVTCWPHLGRAQLGRAHRKPQSKPFGEPRLRLIPAFKGYLTNGHV